MNISLMPLLEQQHAKLRLLREDTQDLAELMAESAPGRFYLEMEQINQSGFLFDTAELSLFSLKTAGVDYL